MSNFNVVTAVDGDFTIISVNDGTQPKVYLRHADANNVTAAPSCMRAASGSSMVVVDPEVCDTAKKLIADWGHRLGYGPKLSQTEAMEKTLSQIIEMYT